MIHNFKLFIFLLVASIGSLIIVSAPSAHAQGEKWELTSKTTIVVSGGLFNGKNGNPSSITLTGNTTADPVIWKSSQVLNLKDANGLSIEGRERAAGDFCVSSFNTTSLLDNRTSVGFSPIVRGDCNKGATARFVDQSAGTNSGTGTACASGVTVWRCNGIWDTSLSSFVTPTSKITYAIPGAPLKCGDIGFVGPCQSVDYTKMDCTKTDGTAGQAEQCAAIKGCILDAQKKQADCSKAWGDCIATYTNDPGAGYNACKAAIMKGDLTGGKYIADAEPTSESSCKIDGVGWIICPITTLMAGIVDAAYGFVGSLLVVQPLLTTGNTAGIYNAWSVMRNFANVAFVIAFIIIIYSQITGAGINNYGIKKMLPRIIVAAILVNVSYWICAIAVDVSNILGGSLNGLFEGIQGGIPNKTNDTAIATGTGWAGIAGLVLAGSTAIGIAMYVGLAALLPALIAALLAIVTVFLVLTLRQALIILLIVIAPLAFVAYLLPNTEGLFKKWRQLFQTMLLMYPIIAFIFGASALASFIVMHSASGDYEIVIQIMGALIAIIPLAITPLVMKTAGSLLGKFGGAINNPNKGPFDRMKKGAQGLQERSRINRGLRAMDPEAKSMPGRRSMIQFRNKRSAIATGRSEQFKEMQAEEIAKLATSGTNENPSKFAQQVAGKGDGKAALYAAKQESYLTSIDPNKLKLDVDKSQIANMVGTLKLSVTDPAMTIPDMKAKLIDAYKAGDSVTARAAQEILMNSGNKGKNELRNALATVDPTSSVGVDLRKDLASSNMKASAADVYAWSVDDKHRSLSDISADSKTWSGLSDAQVSTQVTGAMQAGVDSMGISAQKAASALSNRGSEQIGEAEANILKAKAGALYTPPQVIPQSAPTILNVTHNQAPAAATGRTSTPPNMSQGNRTTSGLIIPNNYNDTPPNP